VLLLTVKMNSSKLDIEEISQNKEKI